MVGLGVLKLNNKEYRLLDFNYNSSQRVDVTGKPSGVSSGLVFDLKIESDSDTSLLIWALGDEAKDGIITFYKPDGISKFKEIEFKKSYCISHNEKFEANGTMPMHQILRIVEPRQENPKEQIVPPKKIVKQEKAETKVKTIKCITKLDNGSANDGSGTKLQEGMVFGKTYEFKVTDYTDEIPDNKSTINWMVIYHNSSENKWIDKKLSHVGDSLKFTVNDKDMCGHFVYIRAFIKDSENEGEIKVWKHNRFRWFDRTKIKAEVQERKGKPYLANQNDTPTCGMAAVIYLLAKKDFDKYEDFVLQLHQKGVAKCNDYTFDVSEKSSHLLEMNPATNKKYPTHLVKMPYCDWITFSCIRDKENGVINYSGENDESFGGSTVPRELMKLMKEILGFKSVMDNTNVVFNKGTLPWDGEDSSSREIAKMQELYLKGYAVIMLINTNMLYKKKSSLVSSIEHWVVFDGVIGGTITWDEYDFKVFSWGEIRNVVVNPEVFSSNFYGYVYGK